MFGKWGSQENRKVEKTIFYSVGVWYFATWAIWCRTTNHLGGCSFSFAFSNSFSWLTVFPYFLDWGLDCTFFPWSFWLALLLYEQLSESWGFCSKLQYRCSGVWKNERRPLSLALSHHHCVLFPRTIDCRCRCRSEHFLPYGRQQHKTKNQQSKNYKQPTIWRQRIYIATMMVSTWRCNIWKAKNQR